MTFKYKRKNDDLEKIQKALEKEKSTFGQDDGTFWKPTIDKAGNGYAVIRFLPAPPQDGDEGLPFVQLFSHSFKGPTGAWYIENSLTTLGKDDPVTIYNKLLWNSTTDENSPIRKQVRDQKRRLAYYSNILVVNDPANPENNGKVFKYKYGVKIYEKIQDKLHPTIQGKVAVNIFDPFNGANFEMIIKTITVDGKSFPNYDNSNFESVSSIAKDEAEFNEIWNQQYSLKEIISNDKFKTYEELEKHLNRVLGLDKTVKKNIKKSVEEEDEVEDSNPPWKTDESKNDDDDDDLKMFENLAAQIK